MGDCSQVTAAGSGADLDGTGVGVGGLGGPPPLLPSQVESPSKPTGGSTLRSPQGSAANRLSSGLF